MGKAIVVINSQHKLLPEQEELLKKNFDSFELKLVPEEGWDRSTIINEAEKLCSFDGNVVILSPIPLLLGVVARRRVNTFVFHNDLREKKEVNGKVIYTVAKTGWQLLLCE